MKAANIKYQTFIRHLSDVDRAICDGQEEGFCKIYTKEGSDRILGATIVAADAGNMISEISVAIQAGFGLGSLAYVIHPYPTQVGHNNLYKLLLSRCFQNEPLCPSTFL